jgi:hypothetical protein
MKKCLTYSLIGFGIGCICTYKIMDGINERYIRRQERKIEDYRRENIEQLENLVHQLRSPKSYHSN